MQRRLLREIGLSEEEALEAHRLAPLPCRREMAMLGLLFRIAHRNAPGDLIDLFPWARASTYRADTRATARRHNMQMA